MRGEGAVVRSSLDTQPLVAKQLAHVRPALTFQLTCAMTRAGDRQQNLSCCLCFNFQKNSDEHTRPLST